MDFCADPLCLSGPVRMVTVHTQNGNSYRTKNKGPRQDGPGPWLSAQCGLRCEMPLLLQILMKPFSSFLRAEQREFL